MRFIYKYIHEEEGIPTCSTLGLLNEAGHLGQWKSAGCSERSTLMSRSPLPVKRMVVFIWWTDARVKHLDVPVTLVLHVEQKKLVRGTQREPSAI